MSLGSAVDALTMALLIFLFNVSALIIAILDVKPSRAVNEVALGYISGVMISIAFLSLLTNALDQGHMIATASGILAGASIVWAIDKSLLHEHVSGFIEGRWRLSPKRVWLIAIAMGIHNVPEGLAVGVVLAHSKELGVSTGISIGVHDFVETSSLVASMVFIGMSKSAMLLVIIASSLIESLTVFPGYLLPSLIPWALPFLLATAAGAMIYVVVEEIVPDIMRETSEHREGALLGFLVGVVTVIALQSLLTSL